MTRRLEDLDADDFERLVNDLLYDWLAPYGEFRPWSTPIGLKDGGWDARYTGPFPPTGGQRADWCISAKHSRNQNTLQSAVRTDLNRNPDRRWIVVTTFAPPEDTGDSLRTWLSNKAPGSLFIFGPELRTHLDRHPTVARYWLLEDRRLVPAARVPQAPELPLDTVEQVIAHLRKGETGVDIVGELGMGQEHVARALVHCLRHEPRPPILVDTERFTPEDLSKIQQLRLAEAPCTFVLMPVVSRTLRDGDQQPLKAEDLARALPEERPANGEHAVVAFMSEREHQRLEEQPTGDRRAPALVEMRAEPRRFREWAEALLHARVPGMDAPTRVRLVDAFEGRPGLVLSWLDDRVGSLLPRDLPEDPALACCILLLPLPEAEEELAHVASAFGIVTEVLRGGLDRLVTAGVLTRGEGRWSGSPLLRAAAFRLLLGRGRDRLVAGLRGLPVVMARRAALEFSNLTGEHALLVPLAQACQARAASEHWFILSDDLTWMRKAAEVHRDLAEAALDLGRAVLDRLATADPFGDVAAKENNPEAGVRILRHGVADLVVSAILGVRTERIAEAIDLLAETQEAERRPDRRIEEAAKALADTRSGRFEDLATVLEAPYEIQADHRAILIAELARIWLANGVEWQADTNSGMGLGAAPWNEHHPKLEARRQRTFNLARGLLDAPDWSTREKGWEALGNLWRTVSLLNRGPAPPLIIELADEVRERARATSVSGDWFDWLNAESVTLRLLRISNIDAGCIAQFVRDLPRDPLYIAWRLTVDPWDVIHDVEQLADTIDAGGGWRSVVESHRYDWSRLSVTVAEALVQEGRGPGDVDRLLDQLAAWVRWKAGPLHHSVLRDYSVLREWMTRAPALFEPYVLGARWRSIPEETRGTVLTAATEPFRERLRAMLGPGPLLTRELGAPVMVARIVQRPAQADPGEIFNHLSAILAILPIERRAAFLFDLSTHPHEGVRERVADALLDWLRDPSPPDPRDAVMIVARLADGPVGRRARIALANGLALQEHAESLGPERSTALTTLGRAVLADTPASKTSFSASDTFTDCVQAAVSSHPTEWAAALKRGAAAEEESPELRAGLALIHEPRVAEALAHVLPDQDTPGRFWSYFLHRIEPAASDKAVAAMLRFLVSQGRTGAAELLLLNYIPSGDPAWIDVMTQILLVGSPELQARLVLHLSHQTELAPRLREAAAERPEAARTLRRLADAAARA